ncbi:MAG: ribbon-helix-helix domain-containing protein [Candidatus Bathyarchaeota archaeon]|nr:ribbon-helix-helix domain-containing protein [Candidatus Bathyarchaeota archaeon]
MSRDEWKDLYKEYTREWKEGYRRAMREWRERFQNWKAQAKSSISEGVPFTMPSMPEMPPMPPIPMPHLSTGRSNVVASRIGNEELRLIDMLTEAGVFGTRSEAVAYLVREGINARQDVLDKVSSSLEDIRKIRKEAEEQVTKLKKEIGVAEPEETEQVDIEVAEEEERECEKCGKDLSDLPEDIAVCPYCGTSLQETREHSGSIFRRLKRPPED